MVSISFIPRVTVIKNYRFIRSVSSNSNGTELACKFPQLFVDDPIVKPYLKKYPPIECGPKNWVYTTGDGKFYIDPTAIRGNKPEMVECEYSRVDRIARKETKYSIRLIGPIENGTRLESGTFHVQCRAGSKIYENFHMTVPELSKDLKMRVEKNRERLSERKLDTNVMIFMADSMSRVNFIRQLPKFYKLLTEKMDALVFEGMNVLGDGTQWTYIPMLTGFFPQELPEARQWYWNSLPVDYWPWIFKKFSKNGYATAIVEEPHSVFYHFYKPFVKQPTDYYPMPLIAAAQENQKIPYCMGDTPRPIEFLNFWRELYHAYGKIGGRHFSLLYETEMSHDDYNLIQTLDDQLTEHFEVSGRLGIENAALGICVLQAMYVESGSLQANCLTYCQLEVCKIPSRFVIFFRQCAKSLKRVRHYAKNTKPGQGCRENPPVDRVSR